MKVVGCSPFPYVDHPDNTYLPPFVWYTEEAFQAKLDRGEFLCPPNHTAEIRNIKSLVEPWSERMKKISRGAK